MFDIWWLVWRSVNAVWHWSHQQSETTSSHSPGRARFVLGLVTTFGGSTIPVFSRQLSLAIFSYVDAMSAGDGFGHCWEEMVTSA